MSAALSAGCAFIAFSPAVSLLLIIAYSKAHLIIVVTISAFAYLLSILVSSLVWFPFKSLLKSNSAAAAFIIPTSVLIQALFRCGFVLLYHRVEVVIQKSIEHHERSELVNEGDEGNLHSVDQSGIELSQTARLRLEINDFSCGLAAGLGYGGMHTIMLYGTLLASETDRWGTLYQTSCSFIPSLANAAIIAFFFFFLDLAWMILTFYGMRRLNFTSDSHQSRTSLSGAIGGTSALLSVVILHIAASCVTLINELRVDGCKVSLPILGAIVGITYVFLRIFNWDSYLPEGIRRI